MKFYSCKGFIIVTAIIVLTVLAIISFSGRVYVAFFLCIATLSYLVWTWYDTYYVIAGDQLFYKSALLKGSINISNIVEIVKNKTQFQCSGIKPALSMKGIMIKYNKWDDIYISPKDIDQFIGALKSLNPDIKITE